MVMGVEEQPVAKKKAHGGTRPGAGRPAKGRDDMAVKIDRGLVGMARMLAARQNITMAELLSDMLRGPIERAYAKLVLESKANETKEN